MGKKKVSVSREVLRFPFTILEEMGGQIVGRKKRKKKKSGGNSFHVHYHFYKERRRRR